MFAWSSVEYLPNYYAHTVEGQSTLFSQHRSSNACKHLVAEYRKGDSCPVGAASSHPSAGATTKLPSPDHLSRLGCADHI